MIRSRETIVDGRRVEAVDLDGERERHALVLLHEGLGSVGLWREFPATLQRATGRRVIAYSRFGHGRSEPPPEPRTPAFFEEEALHVLPVLLERFGERRPILIGHSDGASIALIHAAHHEVSSLVLLAPHVVIEDVTVDAIREARDAYRLGELRRRMARHHDDPDAAFWGWCNVWLDQGFPSWTLEPDAERVRAPTLLIQGAQDPYGTLDQLDRIEARVHGPVTRLVVGGGHSPHLEHPVEIVEAIAEHVATLR